MLDIVEYKNQSESVILFETYLDLEKLSSITQLDNFQL